MLAACAGPASQGASTPRGSTAVGFFTDQQADRGAEAFRATCGECHSVTIDFHGPNFEWDWRRRTAWDLFRRMRETMPEDFPGLLSDQEYTDIIAYILRANAYAAGGPELTPTEASLGAVRLGSGVPKTRTQNEREP